VSALALGLEMELEMELELGLVLELELVLGLGLGLGLGLVPRLCRQPGQTGIPLAPWPGNPAIPYFSSLLLLLDMVSYH